MTLLQRLPYHENDPSSSREAAARHREAAASNLRMVLVYVKHFPGYTGAELAAATGMDVYEVRRRLSDAKRLGHVSQGPPRKCRVANSSAVTWFPKEQQGALALGGFSE